MKIKDNARLRRKKRRNQVKVILSLLIVIVCLYYHQYWVFAVAIVLFVLNDVLKADHVFYNPKKDYVYDLEPDCSCSVHLKKTGQLYLTESQPAMPGEKILTALLPLVLKPAFSGKIYDPYVEIKCGDYRNRQYFERGCGGRRYLNLSAALINNVSRTNEVRLSFRHCSADEQVAELMLFTHPDFTKKRVLVIAPHADDAEIAAFGLYSQADTHIITLTAGEIQAEPFQHVYKNISDASKLKGRLRAWDSMAVPLWGGVAQSRCINLGYFCMTLKAMHDSPEIPVSSLQADVSDTRYFRQFNVQNLTSDQHGEATWRAMLGDLKELIEQIKPDVIVMNDKQLDPHEDHIYAHVAVKQALDEIAYEPECFLYYTNHYKNTDMHPFGLEHAIASLAPHFEGEAASQKVCSLTLPESKQKDKVYALEMMHDLKTKKRWKKKRREWLQFVFIKRSLNRYGEDEYFRKAVKENEVFFVGRRSAK